MAEAIAEARRGAEEGEVPVGAMVHARIAELYYGARDEKAGALGSVYDIGRDGLLNHRIEIYGGLMEPECAALLRDFFRSRRHCD